jgi:uncharacterized protein YjbI with pentapeptide repeats
MTVDLDTFVHRVRAKDSLSGLDLRDVDPFTMDLGGLDLRDADLSRSRTPLATGGKFWPFGFAEPYRKARRQVRVRGADLTGAKLDRILGANGDFREAELVGASLVDADLSGADFTMADLSGADLTGAALEGARLLKTVHDSDTRWPEGFVPPVLG